MPMAEVNKAWAHFAWYNQGMSTTSPVKCDESALGQTDAAAALEHFATGRPLDTAVIERVRARAAQITSDIEREHGLVDDETFQSLLDDEA